MAPQFTDAGQPFKHSLEVKFNADAWDILSAIERGFRAQVDVKGKLAEWFLFKVLEEMKVAGEFTEVTWTDEDGKPDFRLVGADFDLSMECKNLRSDEKYADGSYKLETQKTRNQKGTAPGAGTRFYKITEFNVVADCLFNQTQEWKYYFARTVDLERHPSHRDCLKTMQKVPQTPGGVWKATLREVLTMFTGGANDD
jgi:hypothetical protein